MEPSIAPRVILQHDGHIHELSGFRVAFDGDVATAQEAVTTKLVLEDEKIEHVAVAAYNAEGDTDIVLDLTIHMSSRRRKTAECGADVGLVMEPGLPSLGKASRVPIQVIRNLSRQWRDCPKKE
jgi:hypothetical protein